MNLLWRLLPVIAIGLALYRVLPAAGIGARSFSRARSLTAIDAARIANSMQGELGDAMASSAPRPAPAALPASRSRARLDGWQRPYQVRKKRDLVEVISCGEDGECGTDDDIIEVVKADGSRRRIEPAPAQYRGMTPLKR
jgi:hypothetical protein